MGDAKSVDLGVRRRRLLVVAYALSPKLGSEYRSPWELLKEFSKTFDVTVVFGDSDGLMGSFSNFDAYVKEHRIPFRAIKVRPGVIEELFAKLALRMPFALLFPIVLRFWHWRAFRVVRELHNSQPFDVAHQLGPIGFRNPGYLWKLGCRTYWGPVGGAQEVSAALIAKKRVAYRIEAAVRNLSLSLQAHSPYIARAARHFDAVSYATPENAEYFRRHFGREGPVISDQGLSSEPLPQREKRSADGVLRVVWAGSLVPRKNVDSLIGIVRRSPETVEFHIVGGGVLEQQLRLALAHSKNVHIYGFRERKDVLELFVLCDAILITSLSEANTAVLFEAIERGCIPIVPRRNGFTATLNERVACFVDGQDVLSAEESAIVAIRRLLSRATRMAMIDAMQVHREELTWRALARAHATQYE